MLKLLKMIFALTKFDDLFVSFHLSKLTKFKLSTVYVLNSLSFICNDIIHSSSGMKNEMFLRPKSIEYDVC